MTTRLYHRIKEIDGRQRLLKDGGRMNVYHAIAEKAGVSVDKVTSLAYDGPHSVDVFTAQKIIGAVGIIQGKAIGENEMLTLFENDTATIERNNSYAKLSRRYR